MLFFSFDLQIYSNLTWLLFILFFIYIMIAYLFYVYVLISYLFKYIKY